MAGKTPHSIDVYQPVAEYDATGFLQAPSYLLRDSGHGCLIDQVEPIRQDGPVGEWSQRRAVIGLSDTALLALGVGVGWMAIDQDNVTWMVADAPERYDQGHTDAMFLAVVQAAVGVA